MTTEASLRKLDVHQRIINIYFKFHEILFSSYFMLRHGQTDG